MKAPLILANVTGTHGKPRSGKLPQVAIENPWSREATDILEQFRVSRESGLTGNQVRRGQKEFGRNVLRPVQATSIWRILLAQFESIIVLLLAVAAGISFFSGDLPEGFAIVAVIFLNAAIGFVTERHAVRSMEALRQLNRVSAKVRRDGVVRNLSAEELVPGDIVLIEGGDVVAADLRLLESSKLQANESALTGESVPVSKHTRKVGGGASISERKNMLFKGTTITRGSGEGVIVATGMGSELGEISSLVDDATEEVTPLERRLDKLGRNLVWATLAITVFMAVSGVLAGKAFDVMIQTTIALSVAAIPEGLPIVATIALARGMWRMSKRNALVNRLSAVETLGATGVICTDKTGTLTEDRLTVTRYSLADGDLIFGPEARPENASGNKLLRTALEIGVLCNNASITGDHGDSDCHVGDPLEVALLQAAARSGILRSGLLERLPEEREEAFDPDVKMMATYHRDGGRYLVAAKGAGDSLLEHSSRQLTVQGECEMTEEDRRNWRDKDNRMAGDGLRVLALARKTVEHKDSLPYEGLTFIGLVGMLDPPRTDVKDALEQCRLAGIKVNMVTGDQPSTAITVAREVGLLDSDERPEVILGSELEGHEKLSREQITRILGARIFARVSPRQKLELIAIQQQAGSIVAMTGDGVNDAPALKKADIGVAMGQRGTEVAREAADMILKDDSFGSIVVAVRHGRVIFTNIRRFVIYLMSCNLSEIMVVGVASMAQMPLPILPLQILFLNLVTDVFPALALGLGEGDSQVMTRPPRDPKEPILTSMHWRAIGGYGALITVCVLVPFFIALKVMKLDEPRAVTISFLVLAGAQLLHVFNLRGRGTGIFRNDIVRSPYIWGALAVCVILLFAAIYLPGLSRVLRLTHLEWMEWLLVIGFSTLPLLIGQLLAGRMRKS